jgi:multiple sugar transport system substrate-binding protein
MDKKAVYDVIKKFLAAMRKISAGRTLILWALALVVGIFLFKLQSGDLPVGKDTTLVFGTWWEDELEEETLTKLAAEYAKQKPGVTVKIQKMSWDEIRKTLEQTAAEDDGKNTDRQNAPDVFSIDPCDIYELETGSYLAPLENDGYASGSVVPIISFINPLFYNIDQLGAAGFDRPPKNQTEFLSYVQRLRETGTSGAGLALADHRSVSRQILPWIWTAAGNPESTGSFTFNSKEVIATLDFFNKLKQNLFANPYTLSETDLLGAFAEARVTMMIGSVADIRKLKASNLNFSITTIPAPEAYAKKPVFPLTVWYAAVNSKSAYQNEAKEFAVYLRTQAETLAAAAYAVPGAGTLNRGLAKDDPLYAKAFDMYEAGEMVRTLYRSPYINRLNILIHREVELMFRGSKTPEECAASIQRGWEELSGTGDTL